MTLDLSGIPPTSLTGRLLRAPLRLVPPGLHMRVLQGPLRGQRWIVGSATHGCWLGTYEKEKQEFVARLLRPGQVMFDVGANVGLYALLASRCVGLKGKVIAFEPLPGNLDYLRRHLALNRVGNVDILAAAVGRAPGRASFLAAGSRSMGRLDGGGSLEVDVVSLDSLLASGRLPPPDVIKMDIEGGEVDALLGAEAILREHRPTIVLATHGWEKHQECLRLLRSFDFDVRALSGGGVEATDEVAEPSADCRGILTFSGETSLASTCPQCHASFGPLDFRPRKGSSRRRPAVLDAGHRRADPECEGRDAAADLQGPAASTKLPRPSLRFGRSRAREIRPSAAVGPRLRPG